MDRVIAASMDQLLAAQEKCVLALRGRFGERLGAWHAAELSAHGHQRLTGSVLEVAEPTALTEIAFTLRDEFAFDLLSLLSSLDNGDGTLSVVYHLESSHAGHRLTLRVTVPAAQAVVPTVTNVWAHANWHEREAWDMMGIRFDGHPDHRRILLDEDWQGHPLRKDYVAPEFYHGMKVSY